MDKPFVSILVPTKNRHSFLENILRNFYRQDYPLEKMELLIGDDGNCLMEKILPLEDKDKIKYFKFGNISLGEKRNKLCELTHGEIIIFMDDDDFYPPEKVSHCVEHLTSSDFLLAGSSIMYLYYTKYNLIYRFGPYGKYHSTCGTIAFKKEYIKNNKFPNVNKAEEKEFLNGFKTPLIQTDPKKSILVIAHNNNTVDKHKFINQGKLTKLTLDDFNLTKKDKIFYLNI